MYEDLALWDDMPKRILKFHINVSRETSYGWKIHGLCQREQILL